MMGARDIWELSVFFSQVYCEPKISLKKIKSLKYINRYKYYIENQIQKSPLNKLGTTTQIS